MAEFRVLPPMTKQLRNSLMSILVCAGLMIAYYYYTMQAQDLPADTHITYIVPGQFRLDVAGDGQVRLARTDKVYIYKISRFGVRRILRVFHRARYFDRNILAYGKGCELALTEGHQKTAIRHDCATTAPELIKPIEALNQSTRFRRVLADDKTVIRDYAVRIETR